MSDSIRETVAKLKKISEGHLGAMADRVELDHEVQLARGQLYKIAKYAIKLHEAFKDVSEVQGLDGWVSAKITEAALAMKAPPLIFYTNIMYLKRQKKMTLI